MRSHNRACKSILLFVALTNCALAQDADLDDIIEGAPHAIAIHAMTTERQAELILAVDKDATLSGSSWFFHTDGLETVVV